MIHVFPQGSKESDCNTFPMWVNVSDSKARTWLASVLSEVSWVFPRVLPVPWGQLPLPCASLGILLPTCMCNCLWGKYCTCSHSCPLLPLTVISSFPINIAPGIQKDNNEGFGGEEGHKRGKKIQDYYQIWETESTGEKSMKGTTGSEMDAKMRALTPGSSWSLCKEPCDYKSPITSM